MTRILALLFLVCLQLPLSAQFGGAPTKKAADVPKAKPGGERNAEVILAELDAVVLPSSSDGGSPEAIARFMKTLEVGR